MCSLNTYTLPGFPNTNTSPQLKPSYGICRDTTTTALVEAGKAFFGMEQEKNALRGVLEYEAGKRLD